MESWPLIKPKLQTGTEGNSHMEKPNHFAGISEVYAIIFNSGY